MVRVKSFEEIEGVAVDEDDDDDEDDIGGEDGEEVDDEPAVFVAIEGDKADKVGEEAEVDTELDTELDSILEETEVPVVDDKVVVEGIGDAENGNVFKLNRVNGFLLMFLLMLFRFLLITFMVSASVGSANSAMLQLLVVVVVVVIVLILIAC